MLNKRNDKGFTLAELLIVVAIIGVLVSISIPIFANQRQKAVNATNASNIRAAKAAAYADYLTNHVNAKVYIGTYCIETGTMIDVTEANGATPHGGISSHADGNDSYSGTPKDVYKTIGVRIHNDIIMTNPHIYGENKGENDEALMGQATSGEGPDKNVNISKWWP